MMRVICVRTGTKYDKWYEDNLKHMVDNYSGLEYDEFVCIKDDIYDDAYGVFNKFQMFDKYKDGQNIYFDLDVVIKGDCNHFLRDEFTVCHAHWREPFHTPLNSSIISWKGDASHVTETFHEEEDYCLLWYRRGIDQYIYENTTFNMYMKEDGFVSYSTVPYETDVPVYLFNQNYKELKRNKAWFSKYLLERT